MTGNFGAPPFLARTPDAAQYEAIANALGLDPERAPALQMAVEHIVAEIRAHAAMIREASAGRDRSQRLAYVRRLSRRLDRLRAQLADRDLNTDDLLSRLLGRSLGELLSREGFGTLTGQHLDSGVISQLTGNANIRPQDVSRALGAARAWLIERAIFYVPDLLPELVQALNEPLEQFLQIERQNRGDSPGLLYRNHVVDRLISVHRELWAEEPTTTPGGRFVLLCELVLDALGLETDGLERAVERLLQRRRAG